MNEFESHCGCRMPDNARANIVALVEQVLDPARERYGKPVCVNSGYRCARHNAAVGGMYSGQYPFSVPVIPVHFCERKLKE